MATTRSARRRGGGILAASVNTLPLRAGPGGAARGITGTPAEIRPPYRTVTRPPAAEPGRCVPLHRSIIGVDIESSTTRTNSVKAELRRTLYQLFAAALENTGIHEHHRDAFTDRGDGILALVRPVDQVPKTLLLNQAIPALAQLLAAHNSSLPVTRDPGRRFRLRVVLHAGEIHYDENGCFGEALDIAFRLLDAAAVKGALLRTPAPLVLVISDDIFRSVVRHGYQGIDQRAFTQHVRIQLGGHRHRGWLHTPQASPHPGAALRGGAGNALG